ncbi:aldolase [Hymenopellis radicata]|nr:aldolase [Hymenopellis radicata]
MPVPAPLTPRDINRDVPLSVRRHIRNATPSSSSRARIPPDVHGCAGPKLKERLHAAETAIVYDTLDLAGVSVHDLEGTALGPGTVLDALGDEHVYYHLWVATKMVLEDLSAGKLRAPTIYSAVFERLVVELGKALIDRSSGPHFTFVDTRLHDDGEAICASAIRLIDMFEEGGIERKRIIVSIPATEAGLRAVNELYFEHRIQSNAVYVSGIAHAAACAEAGAKAISLSVGPVLDYYERKRKTTYVNLSRHPGMEVIQATSVYFKLHDIPCYLMGTNLRTIDEVGPLGCLSAVMLPDKQVASLEACPSFNVLGQVAESSPAYARAEEVKVPQSPPHRGLLSRMSSTSREMMKGITMNTLGRMKYKMGRIDEVIYKEVKAQMLFQDNRVIALLKTGRGSPMKASTPTKRSGKQRADGDASPPKRKPEVEHARTRRVSMSFSRDLEERIPPKKDDATRRKDLLHAVRRTEEELAVRKDERKPVEGIDYF